jgi:hypothetical protein
MPRPCTGNAAKRAFLVAVAKTNVNDGTTGAMADFSNAIAPCLKTASIEATVRGAGMAGRKDKCQTEEHS